MLVIIARGPHLITFNHNRNITVQHYLPAAPLRLRPLDPVVLLLLLLLLLLRERFLR